MFQQTNAMHSPELMFYNQILFYDLSEREKDLSPMFRDKLWLIRFTVRLAIPVFAFG